MLNKFYIEHFSPKHLQRANAKIGRYLQEIEKDKKTCQEEIIEILDTPTLWEKVKQWLKI